MEDIICGKCINREVRYKLNKMLNTGQELEAAECLFFHWWYGTISAKINCRDFQEKDHGVQEEGRAQATA